MFIADDVIKFCLCSKMLSLSLKELKLIAKNRYIKCHRIMPKGKLLDIMHQNQ